MKKTILLLYFICLKYAVFALATLGNAGGSTAAGTICIPATTYILDQFTIVQSVANTTLNTINFTTTGTYLAADLTDFKLYGNVVNTFASAVQLSTTIVAGLGVGAHSFTAIGTPLVSGTTTYYWIVVDLPATSTPCRTIAVSAFNNTNIVVAAGGTAGVTAAGGIQTINKIPVITASAAPTPLCVGANLTLTGTGVACNAYTWSGPGAYSSAVLNPPAFAVAATNAGIYTLTATNLCGTTTANTAAVVVNPIPTGVTATALPNPACIGQNLTLTGTATGATTYLWTGPGGSGYSSALLNPPAIVVSALDAGIFTLKATTALGCNVTVSTAAVVVNTVPPAITGGASPICANATTSFTDPLGGGVWSSGNPVAATISAGGVVTGIAPGIATISYTIAGCSATTNVTVLNSPAVPVVAPHFATICNSGNVTLTATEPATPDTVLKQDFNSGLAPWTVDNTGSIGTVGGTGWRSCGDGYINELGTYHSPDNSGFAMVNSDTSGAASTTVSSLISPSFSLAGYTAASISFQVAYSNYAPGDQNTELDISSDGGITWSVVHDYKAAGVSVGNNTAFVTQVYSLGAYLGLTNLKARFYYKSVFGWYFAVDNIAITGTPMVVTPTWSPNTDLYTDAGFTIPYVLGTGINTVYLHPTTIVTLTNTTYYATNTFGGCSSSDSSQVTIQPNPLPILGTDSVCIGATTNLSDITLGGSWSSSNILIATVDAVTGVVTGVSAGTTTITYTVATCFVTVIVTVNPFASAGLISGPNNICIGATGTLIDGVAGGIWGVSNTNASISATGVVTGLFNGIDTITYLVSNACGVSLTNFTDTISAAPNAGLISGPTMVCAGSFALLTETAPGGTWSCSNTTGNISATGLFTAVTGGIDTVYYTSITTCSTAIANKIITISPLPDTGLISGPTMVCVGGTINLTETVAGGVWSSTEGTATVSALGVVTGISGGVDTIKYTVSNGCGSLFTSWAITVNPISLSSITGPDNVCVGSLITLADSSLGGVFSSGNLNATITSGGILTGMIAGIDTITYTTISICGVFTTTKIVTINPIPNAGVISGANTVCVGASATLSETVAGGKYTTDNAAIATVDSLLGIVTGVSAASVNINYLVTSAFGCVGEVSYPITVNPAPFVSPISGITNQCVGSTSILSDITPTGVWSSSNNTIASIDAVTGLVSGVATGNVTISYIVTDAMGCIGAAITADTVNTIPLSSPIIGGNNICVGSSITLSDSIIGGTWATSNAAIAIDGITGIATGILPLVDTIFYFVSNNCGAVIDTSIITVHPLPIVASITGPAGNICAGNSVSLTDSTIGGTWSSNNDLIATVIGSTGLVTGLAAGMVTISYSVTSTFGCLGYSTYNLTFGGALPANVSPAGTASICHGIPVYMHVTSTSTGLTYQWLKAGVMIPGATDYYYNAHTVGDYSVIVTNSTCSETISGPTVTYPPTPGITYLSPDILYTGSFLSYQWLWNGNPIPGANTSLYSVTRNGLYSVVVTDGSGCVDTSSTYLIDNIINGVNNVVANKEIIYYPNPATSVIYVESSNAVNIKILDPIGKTVIEKQAVKQVNISNLADGLYLIMIYNQDNILLKTGKFTKL